ncbi:MAG: TetR/AcrR family transcriptional regulator [Phototrophicaceae bacterium]
MKNQTELTDKAKKTRQRIFEVAIEQFVQNGYEETTMRDIAKSADCSLGLAYRYFDSKDAIVLMLWQELADDFAFRMSQLEEGNLTNRYYLAMQEKVSQLLPYRSVIKATIGAAMNPASGVAIVGSETTWYRDVVLGALEKLVIESTDAPKEVRSKQIAMIMYAVHLMLTLVWIYDTKPNQSLTQEALDFMRDTMKLLRPMLILPPVASTLARLSRIMAGIFSAEDDSS